MQVNIEPEYGMASNMPLALVVFLCRLSAGTGDRLGTSSVNSVRGWVIPFITPFTFGEQGRLPHGELAHGNLMVSSVIFLES